MRKTSASLPSSTRAIYESLNVADDVRGALEETASHLISARRYSTEQSFALGEHLERAAELLPDGLLDKWVVQRCGYTARHARTYRAIFRNLSAYKDTLVELAVGSTVLGKLSAAEPDQIEQAIGFATQHGKLRVEDVTALLAGHKPHNEEARAEASPYDVGGLDGLKAIIAIKVREGLKSFYSHLEEIRTHVVTAVLEKRIIKKTLAEQIHLKARLARKELESLAQFVMPNPNYDYVIWETKLPANTRWNDVGNLLHTIGGVDAWPEMGSLRTWLESEVLPLLEWASAKTKDPVWPVGHTASSSPEAASMIEANPAAGIPLDDQQSKDDGVSPAAEEPKASAETGSFDDSTAKRLEAMLAPLGGKVTIERSKAARQVLPEDSIPSLADALAGPPKQGFKRPHFLQAKNGSSTPLASEVADGAPSMS